MNKKYLNKNEQKYFDNLLKDINILKKIDDINETLKINKKEEVRPEIKELLIKQIDDKNKDKTKLVNIDETFKDNLLSIMTLEDFNNIKYDEYFTTFNKNIININFERFKKYLKDKYIKINIDELIPIMKLFFSKKDLTQTDNLIEKINSNSNDVKNEIDELIRYYENQMRNMKNNFDKDMSQKYTEEVKQNLRDNYSYYLQKINDKLDLITTNENLIDSQLEIINEKISDLDSEIKPVNKSAIVDNLKEYYLQLKKIKREDFYDEYFKEREIILKDYFLKFNSSIKIQNLFKTFIIRKNYLIKRIEKIYEQNKIKDDERNEVKQFIKDKIEDIINNIEDKNINEEEQIIIINKANEDLNKIEDNIEDLSTEANTKNNTEIGTDLKMEQKGAITKAEINLINLKNSINEIFNITDKNIKNLKTEEQIKKYNEFKKTIYTEDILDNYNDTKNNIDITYRNFFKIKKDVKIEIKTKTKILYILKNIGFKEDIFK